MIHIYFHCSSSHRVWDDRYGAAIEDLAEAFDHAACVVRSLTSAHSAEDWRGWVLHVRDDHGAELFDIPFSLVIGKLRRGSDVHRSFNGNVIPIEPRPSLNRTRFFTVASRSASALTGADRPKNKQNNTGSNKLVQ
jgi:hypothetical protein